MNWATFGQVMLGAIVSIFWLLPLMGWFKLTQTHDWLWAWMVGFILWTGFVLGLVFGLGGIE